MSKTDKNKQVKDNDLIYGALSLLAQNELNQVSDYVFTEANETIELNKIANELTTDVSPEVKQSPKYKEKYEEYSKLFEKREKTRMLKEKHWASMKTNIEISDFLREIDEVHSQDTEKPAKSTKKKETK